MSYFDSTYKTDIEPVLKDWLTNARTGVSVTDLPLSLANRAQQNLWAKKPWSNLVERVSLSLVGGVYTFPANFGRIVDIWANMNGLGVPSYWYYNGDEYATGYQLVSNFAKGTGYAPSITFNYAMVANSFMRYQVTLEDFTGAAETAEAKEYSFFPANLIILEAQKIALIDKGSKEYNMTRVSYEEVMRDFENCTQWINYDPTPDVNDRFGQSIYSETYSLSGKGTRPYSNYPNSYLS